MLGGRPGFVIGRDTRESGARIEAALAGGLAAGGASPQSLGVVPTPRSPGSAPPGRCPAPVISASHNPWSDNGIKFFLAGGRKLADEVEQELEAVLDGLLAGAAVRRLPCRSCPRHRCRASAAWLDAVVTSLDGRRLDGLHVVVDCAHGAASAFAPEALRRLGARVEVLHAEPDGRNINAGAGSTHPEALPPPGGRTRCRAGLAFDGDADRVLAVDETGQLVDGDHLIALFAVDLRRRGRLAGDRVVVTVMTNLGFQLAMAEQGIEVVETAGRRPPRARGARGHRRLARGRAERSHRAGRPGQHR